VERIARSPTGMGLGRGLPINQLQYTTANSLGFAANADSSESRCFSTNKFSSRQETQQIWCSTYLSSPRGRLFKKGNETSGRNKPQAKDWGALSVPYSDSKGNMRILIRISEEFKHKESRAWAGSASLTWWVQARLVTSGALPTTGESDQQKGKSENIFFCLVD
jgi:hypothetical protein